MSTNSATLAYRENGPNDAHGSVNPRTSVGRVQVLTTAGAIPLTFDYTVLRQTAGGAWTLAAGTEGQEMFVLSDQSSGTNSLTLTGNPTTSDVVSFNANGDWVRLLYLGGRWIAIATNSVTVA